MNLFLANRLVKGANFLDVWLSITFHSKICATSLWMCLEVAVEGESILQKPSKVFDLRIQDRDVWQESQRCAEQQKPS